MVCIILREALHVFRILNQLSEHVIMSGINLELAMTSWKERPGLVTQHNETLKTESKVAASRRKVIERIWL